MRAFVFTSDKTQWVLQAFAHQFNKYMGPTFPALVCGYTPPSFTLPDNFLFYSIGPFSEYPAHRWSNGVIQALHAQDDEIFVWMMDDYLLLRRADVEAISMLAAHMRNHPEIARLDLSTDRLYAGGSYDVGYCGRLDLVTAPLPSPYVLSFQASLWRKSELLKYMIPDESPWDTEIRGSDRMNQAGGIVIGTRQAPLRYLIAVQGGQLALDGGYQKPRLSIDPSELNELRELGFLTPPEH